MMKNSGTRYWASYSTVTAPLSRPLEGGSRGKFHVMRISPQIKKKSLKKEKNRGGKGLRAELEEVLISKDIRAILASLS